MYVCYCCLKILNGLQFYSAWFRLDKGWTILWFQVLHVRLMSCSCPVLVMLSWTLVGKFKCQALVLLVPANFQVPQPACVTLFPALSGLCIFCSCRAGHFRTGLTKTGISREFLGFRIQMRLVNEWQKKLSTEWVWNFTNISYHLCLNQCT